ncbi:uncharacterized protein LOC135076727 [Ostrinia nubilalis]|uniref:uncharacterized protein LOC135076727 n=1 Tax=Ostrinia nubilalis TaxID=29057 RepID=UPI003082698D
MRPFKCCHCDYTAARKAEMALHLRSHTALLSLQALKLHMRPFKCCHCDYTAARKAEMALHLRSHTGVKPYACNHGDCTYRSADHNAMRRHKKTHSKESVYQCKYCPYTAIQSTVFAAHMLSKHPNVSSNQLHQCPYCPFKTVNKDKFLVHLSTHSDKKEIQLLLEMNAKSNKPSWTIPSNAEPEKNPTQDSTPNKQSDETNAIEVFDCDSISESLPQNYSKSYCNTSSGDVPQPDYNSQVIVTDLSKDDNNSDCLISESSNDTMMERHQYPSQHTLQLPYDNTQSNLHGFLNTSVSMKPTFLQNNDVNSLAASHTSMGNNCNKIMGNFPIRLPPVPQISVRNNIMLKPVDKLSLPITKVTGPIITPTQILPVPSSSNSPVSIQLEPDGMPRKKPKISVKSNLILKGPDQENMFHSQQKMAFKRLEDNERFGLGSPMTFNNLITTHTMMAYSEDNMLGDSASTPVGNEMNDNSQIFTFNQQMNVNSITMLPPPEKIQTNDPSYIKLEATIKQNTQSPSLERMCNANILGSQAISHEYKASPPLEDIHKNMSEIKNEVKSDAFYNLPLNNTATNPSILDQYLLDNIIGGHMDLSSVVLPEVSDEQTDVIEIDDNSDDNKLLPRFDMNFPLESLYVMHNDFHFLENDVPANNMPEVAVSEMNRIVTEMPIINQKDNLDIVPPDNSNNDFQNFIQGKKDPMMNTSVRPSTNKINVKNIELMKN